MSDDAWVRGLEAGTASAWERFFDEIGPIIQNLGARLGLDEDDCVELLQLTSIRVLKRVGSLESSGSLPSWAYRIALRIAYDMLRKRKSETRLARTVWSSGDGRVDPYVLEELEGVEEMARLHDALDELGDPCRRLLYELYLSPSPASYKEVSEWLSIPMGGIGPTRGRCLKKLRNLLSQVSETDPTPSNDEADVQPRSSGRRGSREE